MKIIVAITAASGVIYARQLLDKLIRSEQVSQIALIESENVAAVAECEGVVLPESAKIRWYDNANLFAPMASGSSSYDAMVVVPCTVGTLGRVASGLAQSLIERAADVMLKERRRLVMVLRESPYSLIHLRNMTTVTESGGVILPASPSFYSNPTDIESLCMTITERICALLGLDAPHYEWASDGD